MKGKENSSERIKIEEERSSRAAAVAFLRGQVARSIAVSPCPCFCTGQTRG